MSEIERDSERATGGHAAVCFDMDGVIVDSEDYWADVHRETILPTVVPEYEVAVSEITGLNYREIYDLLAAEYEVAIGREAYLELFEDAAQDLYRERVSLLAGFADLLAELETHGVPVAIVSSSPHAWIDIVRERFGLAGFDAIVSAEELEGPGKPHPDIYELAADRLGVDIRESVAVEDSEHGLAAAAAAGATVVAYRIDVHEEPDLSRADLVVDDPETLAATVLELLE